MKLKTLSTVIATNIGIYFVDKLLDIANRPAPRTPVVSAMDYALMRKLPGEVRQEVKAAATEVITDYLDTFTSAAKPCVIVKNPALKIALNNHSKRMKVLDDYSTAKICLSMLTNSLSVMETYSPGTPNEFHSIFYKRVESFAKNLEHQINSNGNYMQMGYANIVEFHSIADELHVWSELF